MGFISQWGALAGRYAALCPPGWPWAHHRMPFHSPTHGKLTFIFHFMQTVFYTLESMYFGKQLIEKLLSGKMCVEQLHFAHRESVRSVIVAVSDGIMILTAVL